ncbi:MAG: relaxase/mobilization nuclease domain-containing protein [Sediminibacterium sp.]
MKNGKNIRGALSYNESKVRAGKAELILAARFGCEANDLSFSQKLRRFELLNEKCTRSGYNTVHISLNFSNADLIDTEKMQAIAQDYMQQLGFEKQPYLVYRHDDAAHRHLHIVTTPIKPNGHSINLHKLVQRKSEPARKNIEESFGLIKAEGRRQAEGIAKADPAIVSYGKTETKQAVSQIVRSVADNYRYTSFEEYNLILRQFNVIADKGAKDSRIRKNNGLVYFITDAKGKKISVGIKASSIYTSPTLKNIERRFAGNAVKKAASKKYTASSVGFALSGSKSQKAFNEQLLGKKIQVSYSGGQTVFIDHRNKTVFPAEELNISQRQLERIGETENIQSSLDLSLLQKLFEPEFQGQPIDAAFFKRKRKKKR